jgi:predicted DNA-binding ribbon-helix-helix protein
VIKDDVGAESLSTYAVFMTVTLSLEDRLVERVRRLAARRGLSLNQLIANAADRSEGTGPY